MYKVFYNEKFLTFSDQPLDDVKNLKFLNESQFDEALATLKNTSVLTVHLYHHNLEKLWNCFKEHLHYLEAAGGLVKNVKDDYLFIFRLGKWDLPKGKVEKGETTDIAALREVQEECGISSLELKELLTITYHIYFQNGLKLKSTYWYKMDYIGYEKLIPQKEEGIVSVKWIEKSTIPSLLDQTYENIKLVLEADNLIE